MSDMAHENNTHKTTPISLRVLVGILAATAVFVAAGWFLALSLINARIIVEDLEATAPTEEALAESIDDYFTSTPLLRLQVHVMFFAGWLMPILAIVWFAVIMVLLTLSIPEGLGWRLVRGGLFGAAVGLMMTIGLNLDILYLIVQATD